MGKQKRQLYLKAIGSNKAKPNLAVFAVLIVGLRVPLIGFRPTINMSYITYGIMVCDTYHIMIIEKLQAYP